MSVDHREWELLRIAALCHDVGFVNEIENNEELGAGFAAELMARHRFSQEEINFVWECILETNPDKPCSNRYSEYLNDADLGYLGTRFFSEWSEKLYDEYVHYQRISGNRKEWFSKEVAFLEKHTFHSMFSKLYRQPYKNQNLNWLKKQC